MNEVVEAFRRLLPTRTKKTGRHWTTFDCPSCGDRRGRGGFVETPTGGFRYRCQNGGCEFEDATGWEPGVPFVSRPRELFEIMGGNILDIPLEFLNPNRIKRKYNLADHDDFQSWIDKMMADWSPEAASPKLWRPRNNTEIAVDFPEIKLPASFIDLENANTVDGQDVQQYVANRCQFFLDRLELTPLMWSPKYKRHVIITFRENNKTIGWIARKVDKGPEFAHIKCANFPTDYMLNQGRRTEFTDVLVMQGAFDAIALRGMCTFGSAISTKQINLLNQLKEIGRRVVLIPDFRGNEWQNYLKMAEIHGWYISVPEHWGGSGNEAPEDYIKDPGDSIRRHGLLYTLETVMNSTTNDYGTAGAIMRMRSK